MPPTAVTLDLSETEAHVLARLAELGMVTFSETSLEHRLAARLHEVLADHQTAPAAERAG